MRPSARLAATSAALAVAAGALGGCSATTGPGDRADRASAGGPLQVVASFYPVEFAVRQVGGAQVSVTTLTKPGAEPHDLELTPKDVGTVSTAGLVVYAKGFQPALDTAVDQEATETALDVAPAAHLDLAAPAEGGEAPAPGAKDPHFWLDPTRYAAVATTIAQRLAAVDPAHADSYSTNAKTFTDTLSALDADYRAGLASCRTTDLVTSHAAFGYLSERYGFRQEPIAGLSPDVEPSAAKLAEVAGFVREHHVTTIYAETLVEPAFAETVARTTGAQVRTLDPIEGLTSQSAGHDYFEVMRSNLATLRAGQACS